MIDQNNEHFLSILDEDQRKKFLDSCHNVKYFHDNTTEEYENFYRHWKDIIDESLQRETLKRDQEERQRIPEKRKDQEYSMKQPENCKTKTMIELASSRVGSLIFTINR
jgi:hypothetical protein